MGLFGKNSRLKKQQDMTVKRAIGLEGFICILVLFAVFGAIGGVMGLANMVNTLLNTAYSLLMNTVFYIMAIAVVAGAIAGLLTEFGVIAILNRLFSPLMKPLYGLPGAAVLSIFTTYLSDNPAVLTLCDDKNFKGYFSPAQLPVLNNIGTAFGMGLVITVFMLGLAPAGGGSFGAAVLVGNLGAIAGSIVSARLMLWKSKKTLGNSPAKPEGERTFDILHYRVVREGSVMQRLLSAMMDGGASGVKTGLSIIPGVLVVCTIVMILTNGAPESGVYTGAAGEGVGFLPIVADKISFLLTPLFGFSSPQALSVPITALGSAGAAIGLVPDLVSGGIVQAGDIAVFTAMCMCWSGYLSTHVAMMDALGCRKLTGSAILFHTLGGLVAGVSAHWLYKLISLIL